MEKFNLNTWLQDKSRKVIDDDGFPVEIIKWDANEKYPVVYLNHNGIAYNVSVDGMIDFAPNHGLFFADEEEELTEFDYAVLSIISDHNSHKDSITAFAKRSSKKLLDLARKEVLKDLPKWKKATEDKKFDKHVCVMDYYKFPFLDTEVNEGDYYIELSDLKPLPKEE